MLLLLIMEIFCRVQFWICWKESSVEFQMFQSQADNSPIKKALLIFGLARRVFPHAFSVDPESRDHEEHDSNFADDVFSDRG